jgi:MYXO-CTERM domain-containing protein
MSGTGGHADGTEGGACYGNGSCNKGLTCLSKLCVKAPASSGCGCNASGTETSGAPLLLIILALAFRRRGGRPRGRPPGTSTRPRVA